jgi:predicted RND superfamily exporter protein
MQSKFLNRLFKYPSIVVSVITVITIFFIFQLPRAKLNNNNLSFLPKDNAAHVMADWIEETFGSSTVVLIGLERRYGTVFDREFLGAIKAFSDKVEKMDMVDEVTTIMNTDFITATADSIIVEPLVGDDFSGSDEEIAEMQRKITSWDLYRNALISDDFTATQIVVSLDIVSEDSGNPDVVANTMKIRDLARDTFRDYATVFITGESVVQGTLAEAAMHDLILLIPVSIIAVLIVLSLSLRNATAVALPLLTTLISVIWSIGAMPLFGVNLSLLSVVLPIILIAVGSAYGIHVVTHYLEDRKAQEHQDKIWTQEEHRELVFYVVRKIAKPVFLAGLTTFAGFFSFLFTPLLPMQHFGIFACVGVSSALLTALVLIPAILLIRGPKPGKRKTENRKQRKDTASVVIADFFVSITQRKIAVLVCAVIISVVSIAGTTKVVSAMNMVNFFHSNTDIWLSDAFIREHFAGSESLSIIVQAEKSEDLLHPDTLAALDGLAAYLTERIPIVGKVSGFTDMIKRMNQVFNVGESPEGIKAVSGGDTGSGGSFGDLGGFGDFGDFGFDDTQTVFEVPQISDLTSEGGQWTDTVSIELIDKASNKTFLITAREFAKEIERLTNYNGMAYYEIPADLKKYGKTSKEDLAALVSNYLVLVGGGIEGFANDPLEPTAIQATVQLRTSTNEDADELVNVINQYAAANFPHNVTVTVGGMKLVMNEITRNITESQIISILFSVLTVFIIIAVSNKSVIAGLICSVPIAIAILIYFAIMGFFNIELNVATALIGSLAVGIGIDYSIHMLEAYKREWQKTKGEGDYLRRTFMSSGKAVIINAISVGLGFAVLMLSNILILGTFGMLVALTMLTSASLGLILIPVLLELLKPKFVRKESVSE